MRETNFLSVGLLFFFLQWNDFIVRLPFCLLLHALIYEVYTSLCYMEVFCLDLTRLALQTVVQLLGWRSAGPHYFGWSKYCHSMLLLFC